MGRRILHIDFNGFFASVECFFDPSIRAFPVAVTGDPEKRHGIVLAKNHIFFNMYTLVMFGMVVERALGTKKFLILYFVTGLGAVALHTGVEWLEVHRALASTDPAAQQDVLNLLRTPMVGASGAIYGVLVAFAMLYPEARMTLIFPPVTLDAKWMVAIFIGIELLTGITGTQMGVAHFAHLGGALFGFLLILYWRKRGELWRR